MSINGVYGNNHFGYNTQLYPSFQRTQAQPNIYGNDYTNFFISNNTQPQEKKSSNGWLLGLGTAIVGAGIWLLSKGKSKGITETISKALEKAKGKAWECISKGTKKTRIKGTSVSGASKPITNAREAEIVQNINTQHVSGNTRKIVEQAERNVVTPEMQAKYDRQIAYKAPTGEEKQAMAVNEAKNKAQRAKLNNVTNNSKGGEKLETVKETLKAQEVAAAKVQNNSFVHPTNKNTYTIKDGQVVEIKTVTPNSKGEYSITDPKKIAKHMAKHNINIADFA